MMKLFFVVGGIIGAIALGLDAFAAHGLKKIITTANATDIIDSFKTAVRYQLNAGIFLLVIFSIYQVKPSLFLVGASACQLIGALLFCGSIYLKTFFPHISFTAVAPLGGITLMVSWLLVAFHALFSL